MLTAKKKDPFTNTMLDPFKKELKKKKDPSLSFIFIFMAMVILPGLAERLSVSCMPDFLKLNYFSPKIFSHQNTFFPKKLK